MYLAMAIPSSGLPFWDVLVHTLLPTQVGCRLSRHYFEPLTAALGIFGGAIHRLRHPSASGFGLDLLTAASNAEYTA